MTETKAGSLGALAAEALAMTQGDRGQASDYLVERLRNDPMIGSQIIDRALRIAANQAVAQVLAYRRSRILSTHAQDRQGTEDRALVRQQNDRVVILASSRLSEFPLPSGKRLSDATRDDLEAAAQTMQRGVIAVAQRANWLLSIARRMPDDAVVSDIFTEADLEQTAIEAFQRGPLLSLGVHDA
jgi:hypothetical protein